MNSIKLNADLFKKYKKVKTNLPKLQMKEEISLWDTRDIKMVLKKYYKEFLSIKSTDQNT